MNTHPRTCLSGNAVSSPTNPTPWSDLLVEVDFKWLMAGQGRWVDSARIRTDPLYAGLCLNDAINSPCDALRVCARLLQASLAAVLVPAAGS